MCFIVSLLDLSSDRPASSFLATLPPSLQHLCNPDPLCCSLPSLHLYLSQHHCESQPPTRNHLPEPEPHHLLCLIPEPNSAFIINSFNRVPVSACGSYWIIWSITQRLWANKTVPLGLCGISFNSDQKAWQLPVCGIKTCKSFFNTYRLTLGGNNPYVWKPLTTESCLVCTSKTKHTFHFIIFFRFTFSLSTSLLSLENRSVRSIFHHSLSLREEHVTQHHCSRYSSGVVVDPGFNWLFGMLDFHPATLRHDRKQDSDIG